VSDQARTRVPFYGGPLDGAEALYDAGEVPAGAVKILDTAHEGRGEMRPGDLLHVYELEPHSGRGQVFAYRGTETAPDPVPPLEQPTLPPMMPPEIPPQTGP